MRPPLVAILAGAPAPASPLRSLDLAERVVPLDAERMRPLPLWTAVTVPWTSIRSSLLNQVVSKQCIVPQGRLT